MEDHRHRVFKHRESQRTEEQHAGQKNPADNAAVGQEVCQLRHDGAGLPGHQPFKVSRQGLKQLDLLDEVRQRDHRQDQQGHDGQQRVVGDGTCQQEALVGSKALQSPQGERAGVPQDLRGVAGVRLHWER